MHMYVSFSSNAICIDLCTLVIAKAPSLQSLLSGRTFVFSLGSLLKKQELPKNLPQSHSPNAAACGYLQEQETTQAIITSCKLLNFPNFYRDYLLNLNNFILTNVTFLGLVIPPTSKLKGLLWAATIAGKLRTSCSY